MKNRNLLIIISLFISTCLQAQQFQTDSISRSEIGNLQFMTGKWSGTGWMMGADGNRHSFEQHEDVQFRLDGMILIVEGIGRQDGKTIHHALAVVSFNTNEDKYSFNSWLADGRSGTFSGELVDNGFRWYPSENTRYTIEINDAGQWYEIGEMNRNQSWFRFFEMTLNKD